MPDLFVIEAPGKAKLLEGILRELRIDAKVQATRGHFMAMPGKLKPLGIDSRMREFMRVPSNPEVFMRLRDMAREADNLFIATDADQEGDVIAWDVHEATRDIHPSPAASGSRAWTTPRSAPRSPPPARSRRRPPFRAAPGASWTG